VCAITIGLLPNGWDLTTPILCHGAPAHDFNVSRIYIYIYIYMYDRTREKCPLDVKIDFEIKVLEVHIHL